jgi:hypothetical protein
MWPSEPLALLVSWGNVIVPVLLILSIFGGLFPRHRRVAGSRRISAPNPVRKVSQEVIGDRQTPDRPLH